MSKTKRAISPFIPLSGGIDEYHSSAEKNNNRLRGNDKTYNIFIDNKKIYKRPGFTFFGPYLHDNCHGLHEYIDANGAIHLFMVGSQTVWEVTATALTEIKAGLTQEDIHFHTHRLRCWYNGATTQRKITITTDERVGVIPPDINPVLAEGAAGSLDGDYGFKYTFIIKEGGVMVWESNPSAAVSINVTSKKITVTCGASADSRVNGRRIYRTSASGNVYQEDGDIDDNLAATTYTSEQADNLLGKIVETNHGVPAQGEISEGCNERMFWLDNSSGVAYLRWSENAYTESYQEYQQSLNYRSLPSDGEGVWLRRLYNANTLREDLYIGQESGIHVLPAGDPRNPIANIHRKVGGIQHDNVAEYDSKLVFLSQKGIIYQISGGRLIDISSRNIPKSVKLLIAKHKSRGAVIFDHYYAVTCNVAPPIEKVVWLCDLRTLRVIENNLADAVWFPWQLPLSYILQRNDGTVIAYHDRFQRLVSFSMGNKKDEYGDLFFSRKDQPVLVSGKFTDLTGNQSLTFELFAALTGGTALWSETHTITIASDGNWSARVGSQTAVPQAVLDGLAAGTKYYFELTANGETFSPRKAIPLRAFLKNKITSSSYSMIFTSTDITAQIATKFFGAENPSARRIATTIIVSGKQQRKIQVTPRYVDFYESLGTAEDVERDQGGEVLVGGEHVWGAPSTQVAMNMLDKLEPAPGGAVSFELKKTDEDAYFELTGIQYRYTELQRF